MAVKEQDKEVVSWRFKKVEYFYRGLQYEIDKSYTGRGKKLKSLDNKNSLIVIDMPLYRAGVEVIKHCYPVFKKV